MKQSLQLLVALLFAVNITVYGAPQCEQICKMKTDIVEMFNTEMTLQAGALRLGKS